MPDLRLDHGAQRRVLQVRELRNHERVRLIGAPPGARKGRPCGVVPRVSSDRRV